MEERTLIPFSQAEKSAPIAKRNIAATSAVTTGGASNELSWLPSANGGPVYLGYDASKPYNNEISNDGDEALSIVFWLKENAFTTTKGPYTWFPDGTSQTPPALMFDLLPGEKQNVSYDVGFSGAYTAVHSTTTVGSGNELAELWVELTTAEDPNDTTVDVTREPLANGGYYTTVQAEGCTSDITQCYFGCTSDDAGPNACMMDYKLMNCNKAQNPNANTDSTGQNGGCFVRGTGGSAFFSTSFGKGIGS